MKQWDPEVDIKKNDVRIVPIWMNLENLELKYWGKRSLFKIVGHIGKPIQLDVFTKERSRLNYPRILVEVCLNQEFLGLLYFEDEHGRKLKVTIVYEWKPTLCGHCHSVGHETTKCKKQEPIKQQWVVKQEKKEDNAKGKEKLVDDEGFQVATKTWKRRIVEVNVGMATINAFMVLEESRKRILKKNRKLITDHF